MGAIVCAPPLFARGLRDNVGLLIDSPLDTPPSPLILFLTNDLTDKTVTEAIARRCVALWAASWLVWRMA